MADFGSAGWGFESLRSHKITNMEIIALLVLIGMFYWVIKIPYEIIKGILYFVLFIIKKIRILVFNKGIL